MATMDYENHPLYSFLRRHSRDIVSANYPTGEGGLVVAGPSSETIDRKPLLLVVEDDQDELALTRMRLGEAFELLEAYEGRMALELARTKQPHAILLDLVMPGMSGTDLLDALQGDERTADIPVIVLSGLAGAEDRIAGIHNGAFDYIVKPANTSELIARIHSAVRVHSRLVEVAQASRLDPLTALPDARAFADRMAEEIARAARARSSLALLVADVDRMDQLNIAHGATMGDEILKKVASVIRSTFRTSDSAFRTGPDEFSILLPEANPATAERAAERLRMALVDAGLPVAVTLSMGIADITPGQSAEETLVNARAALRRAVESGGDRAWRADDPRRRALSARALAEDLTDREWLVLAHLVGKKTEREIAQRLGIQPGTVRSHKARIRRKLHVAPNVRLADFARSNFRDTLTELEARELETSS